MSESPEQSSLDVLTQIAALAAAGRVVRLGYRRPGEAAASEFLVEPYRLHRPATGPVLHAWQLSPPPEGRGPWRDFRLDRITSAADAGQPFDPRVPVTLSQDVAALEAANAPPAPAAGAIAPARAFLWSDRPIVAVGPADEYFRQLEEAMLDGQVTPAELQLASDLGQRVGPEERKAVHARVYANVLQEVIADGRISHREELYLRQVRELLQRLGWAP
jgi:hypothetical protein